jgi:hypothetical protein
LETQGLFLINIAGLAIGTSASLVIYLMFTMNSALRSTSQTGIASIAW